MVTGTVRINGATSLGTAADVFSMITGGLIDVQTGSFNAGSNNNKVFTNNKADLNVAAGASLALPKRL